jgi:hypothetical protein
MDVGERKRPEGIQEVRKSSVLGLGDGIKVGSEPRNGEESQIYRHKGEQNPVTQIKPPPLTSCSAINKNANSRDVILSMLSEENKMYQIPFTCSLL